MILKGTFFQRMKHVFFLLLLLLGATGSRMCPFPHLSRMLRDTQRSLADTEHLSKRNYMALYRCSKRMKFQASSTIA